MTTTRRIQYHGYGGPEVMRLEEFEAAPPGAGEVRVRVRAAATNPMDAGIRTGRLKVLTGRRFPRGLGHDFSGVVEAVGAGVAHLHPGDEVLGGVGLKESGAFADVVVAEAKAVVRKPPDLSFEQAATIPTVGLTAFQALLKVGKLEPGKSVFVTGCLGGVGRSAVQLALVHGATVGGSCRSSAAPDARELGVEPVVDFDFQPEPLRGRYDIVLDTSGKLPMRSARVLCKPGGRIVGLLPSPATYLRSWLPGPFKVLAASANTDDLEEVARAAGQGQLRPTISRTVPLTEAIAALTERESSGAPPGGKLVITTGSPAEEDVSRVG